MNSDKIIYLDNNATTAVDAEVFEAMRPFLCERYGNPSSIHRFGGSVSADIENARRQVAELLGSSFRDKDGNATEIIFTSCGSESDNAAINAAVNARPGRNKIVTSAVEHPGVLTYCKELSHRGYEIEYIPVDEHGRLDLNYAERAIDNSVAVVSIMWANNETGTIFPVETVAKMAHANGALFHSDAVQAAGKVPINLENSEIDFLTISGHKLHAPKGVGALFVRRGTRFKPLIFGGHQEKGRRGGTENVASLIGFGKACELSKRNLALESVQLAKLRDRLEAGVRERISHVRINGDLANRLPNTASISFEYIEGESILMLLDMMNICASSGSACTTGSLEPSHVLRAMNLPYTAAHGTIRFSLSKYNSADEIDFVIEALPPVIERLRAISPYWEERDK
ncbi:MAG: cysteine desulfurase NifS [Victivallales bacterium]|nr:cysteine desulfurase NifS [Victivallales bacterium]